MQQILAKFSRRHQRGQIYIGGRNQPRIHRNGPRRADPADGVILDGREQFRLQPKSETGQLIEEKSPAVRRLHQTDTRGLGIGEGTAFMAEQLRLRQGVGQR